MEPKNEVDKFFEGLPEADQKGAEIFAPEAPREEVKEEDKEPEIRKNRAHRRTEEKLQETREMNIALAERVKILSEQKAEKNNTNTSEMPAEWVALYGSSPEAESAWKVQEKLLQKHTEIAEERAVERIKAEQQKSLDEQKKHESFIDSQFEALEDTYDVDLTSNAPGARKMRNEFIELVQKLSPKDERGEITGYPDFESTFEIYKNSREKEKSTELQTRQKEISTRTMQKAGSPSLASKQITPGFRGWEKDYNLN